MARGIRMTDTLLALVPTYGVWLILLALPLSCLALPVPSSILVMTAGGFAVKAELGHVGIHIGRARKTGIEHGGSRMAKHP